VRRECAAVDSSSKAFREFVVRSSPARVPSGPAKRVQRFRCRKKKEADRRDREGASNRGRRASKRGVCVACVCGVRAVEAAQRGDGVRPSTEAAAQRRRGHWAELSSNGANVCRVFMHLQ
jgi:hypothetical protein